MKLILYVALLFTELLQACRVYPLEVLKRAMLAAPLMTRINSHAQGQWAGRTTILSGSATVAISCAQVTSDSLIFFALEGNANVASGFARATEVKTISDGGYFTIGTQDGVGIARDSTIMWEIRATK